MDKKLEEIENLFKATNLPDDLVHTYAYLIYNMNTAEIDAVHEVVYQLIWERKLAK